MAGFSNKKLVVSLLVLCSLNAAAYDVRTDLQNLDNVLSRSEEFELIRNNRVQRLELELNSEYSRDDARKYALYTTLFEEYYPYQFDKAMDVLNRQEQLAAKLKDKELITQTILRKANLYTTGGFYKEAEDVISGVDTLSFSRASKLIWYDFRQRYCHDFLSKDRKSSQAEYYRMKYMELCFEGTFAYDYMSLVEAFSMEHYNQAREIAESLIPLYPVNSHEYAKITHCLGLICGRTGDLNSELHWYCESAKADVSCAVKDNASLHSVAMNLIAQKLEIERAFRYTQKAMTDALFYNSNLRLNQIVRSLPYIEAAYSAQRDRTEKKLTVMLWIMICLAVGLLVFVMMYQINNVRLKKAIESLNEASAAKEAFLGLFLTMSSSNLDKLKPFLTRSQLEAEFKNFYNSFDTAFVQLYPNFVEEFNSLLKPEARITLKKGELLNTELRIFALVRLGVDKSSHIASLLRYSVNTIYNYRTQIRTAAINQDIPFEEQLNHLEGRR